LRVFDGTSVFDAKPYRENYRQETFEIPEWDERLRKLTGQTWMGRAITWTVEVLLNRLQRRQILTHKQATALTSD